MLRRLRLRDLATLSPSARARERYRRIGLSAAASIGARAIGASVGLVSVPLTLNYLGSEQYGLWITMSSIIAFLGFADFGLANGLLQGVAEADGLNDRQLAREYVSSAFYMLIAVSLALGAVFVVLYGHIPWPRVFNVTSSTSAAVAGRTTAVLVAVSLASLPLGVIQRIQVGHQEGFRNSIWQAVGAVISLFGLAIAVATKASLPLLALAISGGPIAAYILNGLILFRREPWLIPTPNAATRSAAARILGLGLLFFVLQIALAIAFQTDSFVIAQILGPSAVTQYAVPAKLFLIVPMLINFGLVPLWPAYREALIRKDNAWVKSTYFRLLAISGIGSTVLATVLAIYGRDILRLWVGDTVTPSNSLLLALGAWTILFSLTNANSMLLNGANVIGFQVVTAVVMMLTNILLSIVLTRAIGVSGPAWGSAISVLICTNIPSFWYVRRVLRNLTQPADSAGS